MKKLLLPFAAFFIGANSFGQTQSNSISHIRTISQAETYIVENPKANAKVFTLESGSDTSEVVLPLYTQKIGFTFQIDNIDYKILRIDSGLSFRVSYIYLSGDQFSKNQIDSLRKEIIKKYKEGESFLELVQQYNMDGNITGDTKWFTENMMIKEFEEAVRSHKQGDIFTVDKPSQNWYHVVLKTHKDTYLKKLTLIRAKSK